MTDIGQQTAAGRGADRVLGTFPLQHAIQRRGGKRRVTANVLRDVAIPVSVDDGQLSCP